MFKTGDKVTIKEGSAYYENRKQMRGTITNIDYDDECTVEFEDGYRGEYAQDQCVDLLIRETKQKKRGN